MTLEESILLALQTKFEGVDAKILGRFAKKLAKNAKQDDDAKTIVDGVTFQQLIDGHADYRANEAAQTAVSNYEKKHNLQDGKPLEVQTAGNQGGNNGGTVQQADSGDKVPAWAQQLINDNAMMKERIKAYETERTGNARLEAFKAAIAPAPEKLRTRYETDFKRLMFKDDEDFNSYLGEIKSDISSIAEAITAAGGKVGSPLGGGQGTSTVNDLVKARFESTQKADSVSPAIAGLPS